MIILKILSSTLVMNWHIFDYVWGTVPVIMHPIASRLAAGISSFFYHGCCLACVDSLKGCWSLELLARSFSIKCHASDQNKKKQKKPPHRSTVDFVYANKEVLFIPYFCFVDNFSYLGLSFNFCSLRTFDERRYNGFR